MNSKNDPLALPVIKQEYDDVMVTALEGWSPLNGNIATNPSQPLVPTTSKSVSNLFSSSATTSNKSTTRSTVPMPNLTETPSSVASILNHHSRPKFDHQRHVEKLNDSIACSTVPLPHLTKAHKSAPSVNNRQKFDFQRHKKVIESTNIGPSIRNKMPLVPSGPKAQSNTSTPLFNIHLKLKQTQELLKERTNNLIECQNVNEILKKKNKELQLKYFEFESHANSKLDTLHKEIAMLKDELNQLKGHQLRNEPSNVVNISTSANQSNEANMNDVMIAENELLNENENNSDHVLDDAQEMSNTTTHNDDHSVVEPFNPSASTRPQSNHIVSKSPIVFNLGNRTKQKQPQPRRTMKRSKNEIVKHRQTKHCPPLKRFKCQQDGCSATFVKKVDLNRHNLKHLGKKRFHCTWPNCIQGSNRRDHLLRHIRGQHFGVSNRDQKEKNFVDEGDLNEYIQEDLTVMSLLN